ncbi:MAG: hypothetical protein ABMB14_25585, partial [Myxococcota bacterium]
MGPRDGPAVVGFAVDDLREVVTLGLARGEELLTAGERSVARGILALDGEAAVLFARLSARRPAVFHLPSLTLPIDVEAAADALIAAGLADFLVPWSVRARHVSREVLASVCRTRGLPVSGRKDELVARVAPLTGWLAGRWLR